MLDDNKGKIFSKQHSVFRVQHVFKASNYRKFFNKTFPQCYIISTEEHCQSSMWKMFSGCY